MYARLWWKDARQFWPIWALLALAAAVVQGLFLHYVDQGARHGALGFSALTFASLYAFAAGAAAFAGERETETLRLLDILPIDRRVVWASKVSFAFTTTLALTLALLAMAATSTDRWKPEEAGSLSVAEGLNSCMIVLVALGWGLFWSAILSNALTAAVIAIVCSGMSLTFFAGFDGLFLHRVNPLSPSVIALGQLFIFLATTIASVVIFAQALRWKRFQLKFRSPVVVNLAESTTPRQLQLQSPVATLLAPRPSTGANETSAIDQSPRRSWVVEARVLTWQTIREGWKTWVLLAAIGLVLPALTYLGSGYLDSFWLMVISIGVSLVAGASVFGLENRARTQRFLTHHGAQPGLVWLVKLVVWSTGLAMLWGPLALMAKITMEHIGGAMENWLSNILIVPLFFGVALLCGMAIRRGITAVVISLVLGMAPMILLGLLLGAKMLSLQGLLVFPAGLLAISWAWSGDWLLERPAPGRWIRLGLLLTGMFALIVSGYAGYRAWSIPDVGPIAPPAIWLEAASIVLPADENAADLYREAGRRLVGPFEESPEFFNRNQGILDLIRRATIQPNCRFLQPEKLSVLDRPDLPPVSELAYLLALDASERQNHGDLAGAWDDIVALFRMARHVDDGTGFITAFPNVTWAERTALGIALEWAVAHGQTPDCLHAALAAYHDLPKMASAVDVVRAEANLVENALDLPTSRLRDWAFEFTSENHRSQPGLSSIFLIDMATMPWERVRARRVNRLIAKVVIEEAMREPWQRSRIHDPAIDDAQKTSRNAMMLIPNMRGYVEANDRNELARRVLAQVLALREWQLRHGGQFPKSLNSLVPEELPSLPNDPYSGQPFGYVPARGQEVPPLRDAVVVAMGKQHASAPGSWLLYSVGPDGHNDGGIAFNAKTLKSQPWDILFEIPPVQGNGIPSKGQDRAQDAK